MASATGLAPELSQNRSVRILAEAEKGRYGVASVCCVSHQTSQFEVLCQSDTVVHRAPRYTSPCPNESALLSLSYFGRAAREETNDVDGCHYHRAFIVIAVHSTRELQL